MVDVPFDGIEIHQDGRRCAVRVDLLVECVDARHETATAVLAVVVALEAVDAVDERTGLLASVGVLLDEGELRLDGVRRLCGKCRADGRECQGERQHESADFLSHGFILLMVSSSALRAVLR